MVPSHPAPSLPFVQSLSVSAFVPKRVAPVWFSAPALRLSSPCLPARPPRCAVFLIPARLGRCDSAGLRSYSSACFKVRSHLRASRAGEAAPIGFLALQHHLARQIQSGDFQASGSSTSAVSHRLCGLLFVICRAAPGLFHPGSALGLFPSGFSPPTTASEVTLASSPLAVSAKGGHLVHVRVA